MPVNAGVDDFAALAPDVQQPFGRLDLLGAVDAIAARYPSSISRSMQSCGYGVGREEGLELVELGVGEGFV